MHPMAILGAVLGAAIGTCIWGAVAHYTGYEIGYLAWAVGGLVGAGAILWGGQGKSMGVLAACIAVLGILGGKAFSIYLGLKDGIAGALYAELRADAAAYAALPDSTDIRQFMIDHEYTTATAPEAVPAAELLYFIATRVPMLEKMEGRT